MSERRILLVGGAGYIGTVMTGYFLRRGWRVRCLDQLIYKNASCVWPYFTDLNYEFHRGDVRDPAICNAALKDVQDVIILAGLVGDPITRKYPEISDSINREGIRTLTDTLKKKPIERVIFVSTCSNYGMVGEDISVDEEYPLAPLSLYAKHKVETETRLLSLNGKVDFSVTILRFATAFGMSARMRFDLTVNEFVRDMYLRRDLLVFDAETWRPYCHVNDFAIAVERVLRAPPEKVCFEVFNVGSDRNNFTKRMIVDEIRKHVPDAPVRHKEGGTDPRNYRVSFEKIHRALDFSPSISVAQGIVEILTALRLGLFDHVDERKHFFGNYEIFLK